MIKGDAFCRLGEVRVAEIPLRISTIIFMGCGVSFSLNLALHFN